MRKFRVCGVRVREYAQPFVVRPLLFLLIFAMCTALLWSFSSQADAITPPLQHGSVVEKFRAPIHAYAAGNRGWEFAAPPGEGVRAIGSGIISYSGRINGTWIAVVDHGHSLRTTYLGLAGAPPGKGAIVREGETLGTTTGGRFYFGVRCDDEYIDPALILGRPRAVLIALNAPAPATSSGATLSATPTALARRSLDGVCATRHNATKRLTTAQREWLEEQAQ